MRIGLSILWMAAGVAAIYPDNLWDHSVQLTESDFDAKVQEQIDAGKTMFVRFIATPK